jgi:hypothetical protein
MRVSVEGGGLRERVAEMRRGVVAGRRRLVSGLADALRRRAAELTPVRTGRARRGWGAEDAALGQGSPTPAGPAGDGELLSSGEASTGGESSTRTEESGAVTSTEIENRVPYIGYLEYGTRRVKPRAMVRRALSEVAAALRRGGGG